MRKKDGKIKLKKKLKTLEPEMLSTFRRQALLMMMRSSIQTVR